MAGWTLRPIVSGYIHRFRQRLGLLQPLPTPHRREARHDGEPDAFPPKQKQENRPARADETDDGRDAQASVRTDEEPQQRVDDLPAVQWVDRQHVEDQKHGIERRHHFQVDPQIPRVWYQRGRGDDQSDGDWHENDVDERAGGDAPQQGPGTPWWIDIGDSTERPQEYPTGRPAHGSAGQGMSKLVEQHDPEERQILCRIPNMRFVDAGPGLDDQDGHQRP